MKLPLTLMGALLASMPIVGAAEPDKSDNYNFRAQAILTGSETTEKIKTTLETSQSVSSLEGRTAIIIDAVKPMTIGEDVNMTTPLVVREGEVTIGNGRDTEQVNVSLGNTGSSYGARLIVAGKDASLTLKNANVTTTKPGNGNNSMTIGGQDGDGKLTVTEKSSLFIQQALFSGYESVPTLTNWTGSHVAGTFVSADANDNSLYCKIDPESKFENKTVAADGTRYATSTILIEDASQVEIGGGMYLGNATVTVTGKDTQLKVGTNTDANSVWLADFGSTTLNVADNATFYSGKKLTTGDGDASSTSVNVTNATFIVESTVTLGCKDNNSTADFKAEHGAEVKIDSLEMGTNGSTATMLVASGAKYTGASVKIGQKGTFTLEGSMELEQSLTLEGGQFIAKDGSSMASLEATGGEFQVGGSIDAWGDIALSNAEFIFADGAVIDLNGNDFTFGEGSSITIIMSELETQLVMLADADSTYEIQGITFNNAGSVTGLDGDIEVTLLSSADADPENALTVTLSASKVTVNPVPEPTTATLSLLALMGLAARRRRK